MTAPIADVGGQVLRTAVTALARVRRPDKPMHPVGEVSTARLERHGAAHTGITTGSAFLDDSGVEEALVRLSRAAGLRPPWPDVNGLALRVSTADDGLGDVLMSTTGWSRPTRYVLLPHRRLGGGSFTTLLPYRTPLGPVHVGARRSVAGHFALFWARPTGRWNRFADLVLSGEPGVDADVSFDALVNVPDGLEQYDWHRRLREPSYAASRSRTGRTVPVRPPVTAPVRGASMPPRAPSAAPARSRRSAAGRR
jgi:hypothetical protein